MSDDYTALDDEQRIARIEAEDEHAVLDPDAAEVIIGCAQDAEAEAAATRRKLVYVAGPYAHPDPVENTRKAIDAWMALIEAGYAPVVPHLSMLLHLVYPQPPEFWYAYDLHILERCDLLVRLDGESWGSDREVEYAEANGIPVLSLSDALHAGQSAPHSAPDAAPCPGQFRFEYKRVLQQSRLGDGLARASTLTQKWE